MTRNRHQYYSAVKRLLEKYNIVFKSSDDYEKYIDDLTKIFCI
jgi:hypothetical protein